VGLILVLGWVLLVRSARRCGWESARRGASAQEVNVPGSLTGHRAGKQELAGSRYRGAGLALQREKTQEALYPLYVVLPL
jgi:hypothetical protein